MTARRILRTARRSAGMTQRQLARAAGVPQATVGRIEAGVVSPRADTLQRLLAAAGYELAIEPRLGVGVDRTLIRDRLVMTPDQRGRAAAVAGQNLSTFIAGARVRAKPQVS